MSRPAICLSTSTYPPQPGGVAAAAQRLARDLSEHYDVHVVVAIERPHGVGEVETGHDGAVTVHRVYQADPSSSPAQFALRQAMRGLDDRHGFALFHGFFLTAAVACVYAAMRGRRPSIASLRGSDAMVLLEQPVVRTVLLATLRSVTWITSVNDTCLARAAEEVPVAGRSSVIRNGVADPPAGEPAWSLSDTRRGIVGTIGEFRAVKDVPLLIRAYATVPRERRRALYLGGFFSDADEESWSRTLIGELGLSDETIVTGQFEPSAIGRHLAAMHVYVQPSASEGGANAVLEAAARGVPIVATAVGGMREVLVDGESALLVPHGERDQMGAAIARVLTDHQLAERLSAGGLALAARMSRQRERDQWLALYERLLHGAPSAR